MRRCLSCGRTPESKPYGGEGAPRCRPTYCCEQGINPRARKHVAKRKHVRYEAEQWPRPKGWRLDVFYNLGWHAFLRGPDGANVAPLGSGGFGAYGKFHGTGETVRGALLAAATEGHQEVRRAAEAAKVYSDAAASI